MNSFDARLKTPFTGVIAGPSFSGKTQFVRRLLEDRWRLIDKQFDEIFWFYGQETTFLQSLNDRTYGIPVTIVKGLPDSFEEYIHPGKNTLFVIDDLMQSAGGSPAVTDLFCNKVQHAKISVLLLIQNLFYHGKERTTLVRCAHYLVVFKNPMDNSIPLYLAQKLMPLRKKLFLKLFDHATSRPHGYLFCDGKQDTPDVARFRSELFDKGIQRVFVVDKYGKKANETSTSVNDSSKDTSDETIGAKA